MLLETLQAFATDVEKANITMARSVLHQMQNAEPVERLDIMQRYVNLRNVHTTWK